MKYRYYRMPFLTQHECDQIINFYNQESDREVNDYVTLTGRTIPRDQKVVSLTDRDNLYTFFQNRLREKHSEICAGMGWDNEYLSRCYYQHCEQCGITNPPEFQDNIKTYEVFLSRYGVGNFCSMHQDNLTMGRMFNDWYWSQSKFNPTKRHQHPRQYIVSVMLNDDYTGGELGIITDETTNETVSIKAATGEIVVMEAPCWHEVKPVTSGERYVIISWAYTDNDIFIPAGAPKNVFDLAENLYESN